MYIKSYNQSLFEVSIVAASLIKSSTTLSRTRSTSEPRKSLETKLGEALEHDDRKIRISKAWLITFKYHDKKGKGEKLTTT